MDTGWSEFCDTIIILEITLKTYGILITFVSCDFDYTVYILYEYIISAFYYVPIYIYIKIT